MGGVPQLRVASARTAAPERVLSAAVVLPARLIAATGRRSGSLMGIPKLECVVDELAVLTQWPDHWMITQEWQCFLRGPLTLDERSDGSEVKRRVTAGDLAGLLNRRGGMAAGKAQEANEHSRPLDTAGLDHRLGPGGALRAQSNAYLVQEPRAPRRLR